MQPLLFLCHRIPYPPNKGDKIRSYNILKFLSNYFDVHLGAFVDDPEDFQYVETVGQMCASHCLLPLNSRLSKLKCLTGFLSDEPLTLPYYSNRKMQGWVDNILDKNSLTGALVFSSSMAQYISGEHFSGIRRYIDFIDIDSDKWAQYQKQASPIMKLIYAYEARTLFSWEKKIAEEFDCSFFVSEKESELFKKMVPGVSGKVSYFNNGVDTDYFSPSHSFESPYTDDSRKIVFTGAMDYWANVDAVDWFSNEILPEVVKKFTDVKFYIVGAKPDEKVKALAASPYIVVTGSVDDVRPYLAHASVAVAPMRIARGVQNKVLESMAMGVPTMTTAQGYEGIKAVREQEVLVIDKASEWVKTLVELLNSSMRGSIGLAARNRILTEYSWDNSLTQLKKCLEGS